LLYKQKNIKLENRIKNYFVKIDKEIIERVFINILTNAIKYTPNNGKIILKSEPIKMPFLKEKNAPFVKISISDTGVGIPSDKLDKVFGKFEQVIAKKSGLARSTGIGLTFCKLFIEAHSCLIGVESESEEGTTFWFTLPKGEQKDVAISTKNKNKEVKTVKLSTKDKKILLPFVPLFQNLEVYESTDIKKILAKIDSNKSDEIEKWKIEIENAVYAMNEERYKKLIEI